MATLLYFVKLALTGLSPAKLIEKARAIIVALTGNANFATPTPTLLEVTAATDAVEAADADVLNNGGKKDYLARDMRVQTLRDLLTLLGAYVQVTSGGDPEKILSAGYGLRKAPEPVGQGHRILFLSTDVADDADKYRWSSTRRALMV